jgi:hypothetical protein
VRTNNGGNGVTVSTRSVLNVMKKNIAYLFTLLLTICTFADAVNVGDFFLDETVAHEEYVGESLDTPDTGAINLVGTSSSLTKIDLLKSESPKKLAALADEDSPSLEAESSASVGFTHFEYLDAAQPIACSHTVPSHDIYRLCRLLI